jgi:hypothetical protein
MECACAEWDQSGRGRDAVGTSVCAGAAAVVREHVHVALLELDAEVPTGLAECPSCGRTGLPDRVQDRDW